MTRASTGGADDRWELRAADRALLGNKSGATRLGFAVLLKVFAVGGRFPRRPEDVPLAAVEAIAPQVDVPAAAWRGYAWQDRTIEYHRAQIRAALGLREATDEDAAALAHWLTAKGARPGTPARQADRGGARAVPGAAAGAALARAPGAPRALRPTPPGRGVLRRRARTPAG